MNEKTNGIKYINDLLEERKSLKDYMDLMELSIVIGQAEYEEESKKTQEDIEYIQSELDNIFYDEYEDFYNKSISSKLSIELVFPYDIEIDKKGNVTCIDKDSVQYKEDVDKFLNELEVKYKNKEISKDEYISIKEDAKEIANKQLEKIEDKEKEKEAKVDLDEEYENIMDSVKSTRDAIVYNQIGENSYGILKHKYTDMTELDRKNTLVNTNTAICKELDTTCNISFTKYDLDTSECVNKEGYCILTKDVKGNQYPLEVMLFEQISKVYIKEVYNNKEYTPLQKERLALLVSNNIDLQKKMILDNYKKREMDIYKN